MVAILPALSVDMQGNRLGYGGGFYDRFFAQANTKYIVRLAVVPQAALLKKASWQLDETDQRCHLVATEDALLECNSFSS
jgi:5-formyltetrahydrofolate cyclo-ligase